MSSGIFAPSQIWPPRWPPQTAAVRNAPAYVSRRKFQRLHRKSKTIVVCARRFCYRVSTTATQSSLPQTLCGRFVFENMSIVHRKSCVCWTIAVRRPNDARTGIVQLPQRCVYGLRAYDFLKICITFITNRRGCDARESVRNSHGSRLPPHGGRTEREIRAVCGLRRHIASQM